jgi:hypothetical protein
MEKQTAVEWFFDRLKNHEIQSEHYLLYVKARAMEEENIMKAFSDGQETPISHPNLPHYSKEEYYEEKYNNGK